MKPHKPVTDLGLTDDEMQRMIDGARVAFGSPDEYGNTYPNQPPLQQPPQKGKIPHEKSLRR